MARRYAPDFVKVDVEEYEHNFTLILKWDFSGLPEWKAYFIDKQGRLDGGLDSTKQLAAFMKGEVEDIIKKYGKDLCDSLMDKFKLKGVYGDELKDKNILYSVNEGYFVAISMKGMGEDPIFLYYFNKCKLLIAGFKDLWTLLAYRRMSHDNSEAIYEYTRATYERFKQLLFAHDRIIDILSKGRSDPNIQFIFSFHFSFFVTLIKTLGDNIAWLLNLYLKLDLPYRVNDYLDGTFREAIRKNHPKIASSLYSDEIYSRFKKLNEFRDVILHRHIVHIMTVTTADHRSRIMIPKNPENFVSERAKLLTKVNPYVSASTSVADDFINPVVYCDEHLKMIIDMFSVVFQRILYESLREPIGKVIRHYPRLSVGVIKLTGKLRQGDFIMIEGDITSFIQKVSSLEIDKKRIEHCENCDVGVQVECKVRTDDTVYKINYDLIKKKPESRFTISHRRI
jgi:hypothetical protein